MKILGIGTDLVSIARIEAIWNRFNSAFARRILTPHEMQELNDARHPVSFLAKRFAAKEAVAKALGTGFRPQGILLSEIGIHNDDLGRPYLVYSGNTGVLLKKLSVFESHLSISDEKEYALAFVILIGK